MRLSTISARAAVVLASAFVLADEHVVPLFMSRA